MTFRLLIADDEDLVRRGLVALIAREAPDIAFVSTAVDGLEAVEVAARDRPDIVLTDIRMPGLNGLDLIQRLRSTQPDLRCIILSGYDEFDYARRAIGLGVAEYLLKPVDPDDLLATLQRTWEAIVAERHDQQVRARTRRIAAAQGLRKLLDGSPVAVDTLAACLPAAAAWSLLLVQAREGISHRRAELEAACQSADPEAIVVEDAYGYLCVLLPLPSVDATLAIDAGRTVCRVLHSNAWPVTVLVARPCENLLEIGAAYGEALQVAEYHGARADGEPIRAWETLYAAAERWPMLPTARRDALLAAVAAGNGSDAAREAQAFMTQVAQDLPPGALRALWFEMIVLVIHHVQQYGVRADAVLDARQDLRTLLSEAADTQHLTLKLVDLARRAAAECGRLRQHQTPRLALPELREYIQGHLAEDLTITTLARRVHLNAKYVGELFKQATGEPLGAYIIRMRIQRACELLIGTSLKTYTIAEQVGYANARHFAAMFRSVVGVSPAEYRDQHRASEIDTDHGAVPCNN